MKIIRRLLADDRGNIEELPSWTILTIGGITVIGMAILFGRVGYVDNTIQQAAYAAARDASLSRGADAVPHAIAAAEMAMGDNVECQNLNVTVSGNGLTTGLGESGTVTATITCTVSYTDLVLVGLALPGSHTVTASATSPVDPYRER